jgi:hypothetical protein
MRFLCGVEELKNFGRHPKKTFSTQSANSDMCGNLRLISARAKLLELLA